MDTEEKKTYMLSYGGDGLVQISLRRSNDPTRDRHSSPPVMEINCPDAKTALAVRRELRNAEDPIPDLDFSIASTEDSAVQLITEHPDLVMKALLEAKFITEKDHADATGNWEQGVQAAAQGDTYRLTGRDRIQIRLTSNTLSMPGATLSTHFYQRPIMEFICPDPETAFDVRTRLENIPELEKYKYCRPPAQDWVILPTTTEDITVQLVTDNPYMALEGLRGTGRRGISLAEYTRCLDRLADGIHATVEGHSDIMLRSAHHR